MMKNNHNIKIEICSQNFVITIKSDTSKSRILITFQFLIYMLTYFLDYSKIHNKIVGISDISPSWVVLSHDVLYYNLLLMLVVQMKFIILQVL